MGFQPGRRGLSPPRPTGCLRCWYPAPAAKDTVATPAAACLLLGLPDDVIAEILARAPDAASLFHYAAVCKRWRGIVSDPAFLRRRCRLCLAGHRRRPSLLGFFVQRHVVSASARSKTLRNTPTWAPVLVSAPGSALGPAGPERRRLLTSFLLGGDAARALDDARPVAAHDGLLLLHLLPKYGDKKTGVLRLCVCDLVTGKRDLLPPVAAAGVGDEDGGSLGYAVLRAAAGGGHGRPANGYSTLFRVLFVGVHCLSRQVYIVELSSDGHAAPASPRWAWNTVGLPPGFLHGCRHVAAVVSGGDLHWLFHANGNNNAQADGGHGQNSHAATLSVNISTGQVRARRPVTIPAGCSAWLTSNAGGNGDASYSLLLACDGLLKIVTRKDAASGAPGTSRIVHVAGGERGLSGMEPVCVAGESGAMLVLYRSDPDHAYLLDIQSGSTTVVAGGKRSLNYATAVACEVDLLEFFMARLGVQETAADAGPSGGDAVQPVELDG